MHKYQEKIIALFRKEPNNEISTGEILSALGISFSDSEKSLNIEQRRKLVRERAKAHRAVLYHLNLLVSEGILKVARKGAKGEKHFELNLEQGEELTINLKKKHLKITKPQLFELPIKPFEEQGVAERLGSENWVYKLNAVMFECSAAKSIEELDEQIEDAAGIVNDAIALNDFDFLLRKHSQKELMDLCDSLEAYAKDFGKKFSIIFSVFSAAASSFMSEFAKKDYEHISAVFTADTKSMQENKKDVLKVIQAVSGSSVPLSIANMNVHGAPIFSGSFGVYSISADDWKSYLQKQKLQCFVVSQASLRVDLEKFYQNFGLKLDNFVKFLLKCSETILAATTAQRNNAPDYFDSLVSINKENAMFTFDLSKNYVRLVNFKSLNEKLETDFDVFLFNKIRETLKEYSASEETIFISCGMPARFRISGSLLETEPVAINSIHDFDSDDIKNMLKKQEEFSSAFPAEVPLAVKRNGEPKPEDVFSELNFIMNNYSFPLINYSFRKIKGANLKLTDFVK